MPLLRHPASLWTLALAMAAAVLWTASQDPFWTDYGIEALTAVDALAKGDWAGFTDHAPSYGASLIVRAPLILSASALGGGEEAMFRAGALPGLVGLAAIAVHLARRNLAAGAAPLAILVALALSAGGPILRDAIAMGHPEEVMAAAASVGAILVAISGRPLVAGLLLGLAIASKQWAVMAALPVLLAAPRGHLKLLLVAAAVAAGAFLPLMLADSDVRSGQPVGMGPLFHSQQVWWLFGVEPAAGVDAPGPLVAPQWLSALARPLILLVSVGLSGIWWLTRRAERPATDVLLLFAVIMLARCLLDPWNIGYYHAPFLLSLLAWEIRSGRHMPLLTAAGTAAVYFTVIEQNGRWGDAHFALYVCWAAPLAAYLAWTLFGSPANLRRPMVLAGTAAPRGA